MGDFSEYVKKSAAKGNGQPKAIQIGSTHYNLAEISFYMNQTPKEILTAVCQNIVQVLQQQGDYAGAQAMIKNPQPFAGSPQAMAVFMAASLEIEKANDRIETLTSIVRELAGAANLSTIARLKLDALGVEESDAE